MRQPLLMPKLGLTMTEGIVAEWCIQAGQTFKAGQSLYIVETDKVANEIPADSDGHLIDILVPAGQTVPVGTVLGHWDGDPSTAAPPEPPLSSVSHATEVESPPNMPQAPAAAPTAVSSRAAGDRVIASPYARKLAGQRGLDLRAITGSGPAGRIVARDLPSDSPQPAREAPGVVTAPSNRQRTVAQRLTRSKQEIPHFYLFKDIDVTELMALRKKINHGETELRISMTHLVVRAVALGLAEHPEANRVWGDAGLRAFDRIDVGIAVDTPAGLVAPAVLDIGNLRLEALAGRINALIAQARQGALLSTPDAQAAITVSNAGMHDVTYMSSIIDPGQSMILGVGAVRPVFRPDSNGQPVLRQELGVVLSVDHRVLNGVDALKFLNTVSQRLERPLRLLVS